MRVTNSSYYRNFTNSINDVHGRLNKSMNKVSSGKAYEKASDNPLAYYEGKKIDNQYQDTLSKLGLITNVKNRLYQQELGARSIQNRLSEAKKKIEYVRSDSNNSDMQIVQTVRDDLLQKQLHFWRQRHHHSALHPERGWPGVNIFPHVCRG